MATIASHRSSNRDALTVCVIQYALSSHRHVIVSHTPSSPGTVALAITVDNAVDVYHNREIVYSNGDWRVSDVITLDNPCVLAFRAVDYGVIPGILASTSTGVVTDETWKCSTVEQTGWYLYDFDDSAWDNARVVDSHGASPWGTFSDISADAKWIWAQGTNTGTVYCRKKLCLGTAITHGS